ncbi:hypothetical protein CLM62_33295 [Streptomyces sp. SA15]|uniref:SMI1/KNR4 family protein n=1 Tax=Streptomyces sp. SA15 TaxID=934019 RepID=UPI000BAF3A20|nr:SMI1/KNR4 family protein [Streptomyces sp. SA15]PAZ11831.1 hypothetical protein CLM62_33295 [Streptomyces sp. SA15]
MSDPFGQLRQVVTPLHAVGDTVDWRAAATELSVEAFPGDYRRFVSAYGAGSIEDSLYVSIPRPGESTAPLTVGRLPDDTLRAESMGGWRDRGAASRYELEDMVVWGQTNGADALCWATADRDPDRWPVAVWARQQGGWSVYDCGFAEFILRLLRADFATCPISVASLWGKGTARFLNLREEERLRDEGLDPWTGEPDPFAGMEFD